MVAQEALIASGPTGLKKTMISMFWYGLYFWGAVYAYYVIILLKDCFVLRKFKGMLPLPVVGNLYTYKAFTIIKFLSSMRKKYGKIFTFFMFSRPYVVVCEPELVNIIFRDTKDYPKGEDYDIFAIPFGQGLVTSGEEKHKKDKAIFLKFFIRENVVKYVPIMNEYITTYMAKMIDPTVASNTSVDIEAFFATLAMRTFSKFSMNWKFKSDEREVEVCAEISSGSNAVGNSVVFSWLPKPLLNLVPYVKEIKATRAKLWENDVKPFVEERRRMIRENSPDVVDDMMTIMIKENFNDKEIMDHVLTLLSAGHDTTAYFSSYFMFMMGKNQEIQEKLYQEIKNKIGDKDYVDQNDYVEMEYLNACMQETLRLYAIIPQVTRTAKEEMHVKLESGKTVVLPKGCNLYIPMFLINRDPEIWDRAADFVPERFLGDQREEKANIWNFTSKKKGFFPFGHGGRVCIGNKLAEVESAVFICRLLQQYKVLPAEKWEPKIMSGISLTTSNGIYVKMVKREAK